MIRNHIPMCKREEGVAAPPPPPLPVLCLFSSSCARHKWSQARQQTGCMCCNLSHIVTVLSARPKHISTVRDVSVNGHKRSCRKRRAKRPVAKLHFKNMFFFLSYLLWEKNHSKNLCLMETLAAEFPARKFPFKMWCYEPSYTGWEIRGELMLRIKSSHKFDFVSLAKTLSVVPLYWDELLILGVCIIVTSLWSKSVATGCCKVICVVLYHSWSRFYS